MHMLLFLNIASQESIRGRLFFSAFLVAGDVPANWRCRLDGRRQQVGPATQRRSSPSSPANDTTFVSEIQYTYARRISDIDRRVTKVPVLLVKKKILLTLMQSLLWIRDEIRGISLVVKVGKYLCIGRGDHGFSQGSSLLARMHAES